MCLRDLWNPKVVRIRTNNLKFSQGYLVFWVPPKGRGMCNVFVLSIITNQFFLITNTVDGNKNNKNKLVIKIRVYFI